MASAIDGSLRQLLRARRPNFPPAVEIETTTTPQPTARAGCRDLAPAAVWCPGRCPPPTDLSPRLRPWQPTTQFRPPRPSTPAAAAHHDRAGEIFGRLRKKIEVARRHRARAPDLRTTKCKEEGLARRSAHCRAWYRDSLAAARRGAAPGLLLTVQRCSSPTPFHGSRAPRGLPLSSSAATWAATAASSCY